MDYYGFYTGKEFTAYEYLGAHIQENGTVFRTFVQPYFQLDKSIEKSVLAKLKADYQTPKTPGKSACQRICTARSRWMFAHLSGRKQWLA